MYHLLGLLDAHASPNSASSSETRLTCSSAPISASTRVLLAAHYQPRTPPPQHPNRRGGRASASPSTVPWDAKGPPPLTPASRPAPAPPAPSSRPPPAPRPPPPP